MTVLAVNAITLTPRQALARLQATSVSSSAKSAKAKALANSEVSPAYTFATSTGQPAIYAFQSGDSGCIFVGADDVAMPLIGYTDGGRVDFNNLPPNMKAWMDSCATGIGRASIAKEKSSQAFKITTKSQQKTYAAIAPLLTTKWNQFAPYNNLCPEYDGGISLTGCVATAMAQIMNYHQWPEEYGEQHHLSSGELDRQRLAAVDGLHEDQVRLDEHEG